MWSDAEALRWAAKHWSTRIGVKPSQIHLRAMKTKWGSVSRKGRLTLDTGLLDIPQDLAEYVVIHELVHFLAPNHGKLFKSFLFAYLPDWEERLQRLIARACANKPDEHHEVTSAPTAMRRFRIVAGPLMLTVPGLPSTTDLDISEPETKLLCPLRRQREWRRGKRVKGRIYE